MFSIATAFIAALSSAPASLPYTDVRSTDAQGREIIVRSSEFPDLSGGTVIVEQRLRPLGDGRYEIDARDQSKATLLYHLALCEDQGMKPHQGVGTLSGDMAVGGFTCISIAYGDTDTLSLPEI